MRQQGRTQGAARRLCRLSQHRIKRRANPQAAPVNLAVQLHPGEPISRPQGPVEPGPGHPHAARFDRPPFKREAGDQITVAKGDVPFTRHARSRAAGEPGRTGGKVEIALDARQPLVRPQVHLRAASPQPDPGTGTVHPGKAQRTGKSRPLVGNRQGSVKRGRAGDAALAPIGQAQAWRDGRKFCREPVLQVPAAIDLERHGPVITLDQAAPVVDDQREVGQRKGLLAFGEDQRIECAEAGLAIDHPAPQPRAIQRDAADARQAKAGDEQDFRPRDHQVRRSGIAHHDVADHLSPGSDLLDVIGGRNAVLAKQVVNIVSRHLLALGPQQRKGH